MAFRLQIRQIGSRRVGLQLCKHAAGFRGEGRDPLSRGNSPKNGGLSRKHEPRTTSMTSLWRPKTPERKKFAFKHVVCEGQAARAFIVKEPILAAAGRNAAGSRSRLHQGSLRTGTSIGTPHFGLIWTVNPVRIGVTLVSRRRDRSVHWLRSWLFETSIARQRLSRKRLPVVFALISLVDMPGQNTSERQVDIVITIAWRPPAFFACVPTVLAIYPSGFHDLDQAWILHWRWRHEPPFVPRRRVPCSPSSQPLPLFHTGGCSSTASRACQRIRAVHRRSDDCGIRSLGRSQRHRLRHAGC
jgi:hypothetical protein